MTYSKRAARIANLKRQLQDTEGHTDNPVVLENRTQWIDELSKLCLAQAELDTKSAALAPDDVVQLDPQCKRDAGEFMIVDRVINGVVHGKTIDGMIGFSSSLADIELVTRIGRAAFRVCGQGDEGFGRNKYEAVESIPT